VPAAFAGPDEESAAAATVVEETAAGWGTESGHSVQDEVHVRAHREQSCLVRYVSRPVIESAQQLFVRAGIDEDQRTASTLGKAQVRIERAENILADPDGGSCLGGKRCISTRRARREGFDEGGGSHESIVLGDLTSRTSLLPVDLVQFEEAR
jgi:hypothetical protein